MRQVKKGSTNVSVDVYIIDDTDGTPETGVVWNTSGIDLEYRREGAAAVDITEATLAALTTAHTDGGFLHIGHGYYRLDVPDAAFATGAETVSIQGTVTGMIVVPQTIQLVDFDPEDGTRLGLTALPNAAADAAGGLPISDAGGLDMDAMNTNVNDIETDTNELQGDWANGGRLDLLIDAIKAVTDNLPNSGALSDLATILTDTNELQGDWTNGGRLDLLIDAIKAVTDNLPDSGALNDLATILVDTNSLNDTKIPDTLSLANIQAEVESGLEDTGQVLVSTTIATLSSQTSFTLTAGSTDDDAYNGCIVVVEDVSTAAQKAWGLVSDYTGSTKTVTLAADPGVFTMATTDKISILPPVGVLGWLTGVVNALVSGRVDADIGAKTGNVSLSAQEKLDVNAEADTAISDAALATAGAVSTVDTVVDAIKAVTDNLPDSGALNDLAAILEDTGTTLQAELDGIQADTEDIQTRLPAALVGGRMDSDVEAINNDTDAADQLAKSVGTIQEFTVDNTSFTPTTTQAQVDAVTPGSLEATDDHYIGRILIPTSGAAQYQATDITDYDGTNKRFTFTAMTEAMANNDTFILV